MIPLEHRLNKAALPHILGFMEIDSIETQPTVEELTVDSTLTVLRTLGTQEIENLRDEFTLRTSEVVGELAQQLWRNAITLQDWRDEMRMEIKTAFICQYWLAKGGRNLMTQSDYARIGEMVRQQYRSLEVFVSDIAEGRYSQTEIEVVVERSKLYVTCSELAFEMARMSRGGVDPTYIKTSGGW